jgi:hypothetical protein
MKKLLGALAVSAALTGTTFASPFTDVPSSHWAYGAINDVVASGIMKGYRGGMFKGNETVNRYEMAIIVSRLMKKAHGKTVGADVRRTMDRLGEEFMDELDLIGARLTALENAFHEHVTTGGDTGANGFSFSGETRVRWENRTQDFGPAATNKDDVSRWQARTLLDVEKSVDRADFFVQLASNHTFGDVVLNNAGEPVTAEENLDLNQAWVNFAVTDNTSLKAGRQALVRGNGTILSRYDWLQTPLAWDGLVLSSSYDDIKYSVMHMTLDNSGALNAGLPALNLAASDTELNGLDVHFADVFDGNLHVHYYHASGADDAAGNNAVGNTLDTYGFDWARDYNEWDFYVQYAAQGGDDGEPVATSYDGKMWHLAVGYDVDEDNKVGLSYLSFSGDDTATANNKSEAWVDLAGDNHAYLGFADVFGMTNIEDITFTWDRKINDRNSLHLAYHMFSLENADTRADDLAGGLAAWTGTTNASQPNGDGHFDTDLGNELDLVWKHSLSNDVSLTLGYAMFAAGDYFTANQAAGAVSPDVNYGWVTAGVKF